MKVPVLSDTALGQGTGNSRPENLPHTYQYARVEILGTGSHKFLESGSLPGHSKTHGIE
jgi:hypothetical protein